MSIEFQLAWPCPHQIEEVVSLDEARMLLQTQQPVAASSSVRITANDDVEIPHTGLQSSAFLYSGVSGPFDLTPDQDELIVACSGGVGSLTFGVKAARARFTTDQVVRRFQQMGWGHVEARNESGYLVLIDPNEVGEAAYVKVSGAGRDALGFKHQWQAFGRNVYPGWDLVLLPGTSRRCPQFRQPLKNNPVIKVLYTVSAQHCRRCQGSLVENDFRADETGSMILIQNEDLLYQAALKMLLTNRGSNPFFPAYGTSIRERLGSKALSGVASTLREDVRRALAQVQAYQTEQARYQQVSLKERLYSVLSVDVRRHLQDETTYLIDVTVSNASGEPVQLNIVYTAPGVVALLGADGFFGR